MEVCRLRRGLLTALLLSVSVWSAAAPTDPQDNVYLLCESSIDFALEGIGEALLVFPAEDSTIYQRYLEQLEFGALPSPEEHFSRSWVRVTPLFHIDGDGGDYPLKGWAYFTRYSRPFLAPMPEEFNKAKSEISLVGYYQDFVAVEDDISVRDGDWYGIDKSWNSLEPLDYFRHWEPDPNDSKYNRPFEIVRRHGAERIPCNRLSSTEGFTLEKHWLEEIAAYKVRVDRFRKADYWKGLPQQTPLNNDPR